MKSNVREMRDLSPEELTAKAAELKKELFNLRFQQAMGQIENPMRLRTLRKDIAKTKTILREKHGRV
jgi:large subunit ribosomal protein L29